MCLVAPNYGPVWGNVGFAMLVLTLRSPDRGGMQEDGLNRGRGCQMGGPVGRVLQVERRCRPRDWTRL